jgi:hypothetical protein
MSPAPRYVLFGVLCAAWLGSMVLFWQSVVVFSAGVAWFTTWGIQIVVAISFWVHLFQLPARRDCHDRPLIATIPSSVSRWLGLPLFGRIAGWINPFRYDRHAPHDFDTAMIAAETTHSITFTIVIVLAIVFALRGPVALALFLTLWNVLFNVYPIALQRHNRARLRQLTLRRQSRRDARRDASRQQSPAA